MRLVEFVYKFLCDVYCRIPGCLDSLVQRRADESWTPRVSTKGTKSGEGVEPQDVESRARPLLARDVTGDLARPCPRSTLCACVLSEPLPVSPELMSLSPPCSTSEVSSPRSAPDSVSSSSDAVSTPPPTGVCSPPPAGPRARSVIRADLRTGSDVTTARLLRLTTVALWGCAVSPISPPVSDAPALIFITRSFPSSSSTLISSRKR
ncbi:uncharacterized protein LOC135459656 [Zonotrichia leucophrys gambelii]|uniref:uncharacterized protein LOC135459656 n=1 Tax=Zonotrichia leucophrys gambelii TaxID=257770 RepID=UPI003140512E